MDLGYSDSTAVGGSKYVLVLVDQCTTHSFIYGMQDLSGTNVCEVLYKFLIDAGGFPETLKCNFDPRLTRGKATALLCSHGTRLCAAPPRRQDKNSLVERIWFWAICEANAPLNILPIIQQQDGTENPAFISTPYFDFLV